MDKIKDKDKYMHQERSPGEAGSGGLHRCLLFEIFF